LPLSSFQKYLTSVILNPIKIREKGEAKGGGEARPHHDFIRNGVFFKEPFKHFISLGVVSKLQE
jgi:hypothetical protein